MYHIRDVELFFFLRKTADEIEVEMIFQTQGHAGL